MFSLIGVLPGEMDPVKAYEIGSRKGVFAYISIIIYFFLMFKKILILKEKMIFYTKRPAQKKWAGLLV